MPEITVLSTSPYAWINEKRELVQSTFVVYRDKEGRVGTIVIPKAKPTVDDVEKAVAVRKAK